MKIAACLASRGRPAAMIGVVMSLHRLRSAQHEIDFILGIDEDDPTAMPAIEQFRDEVVVIAAGGVAPQVRGEVENRMLNAAKAGGVDLVTLVSDRTFNISPAWDEWLARAVTAMPQRVMWWSCPSDAGCIIPVIPKAYLEAIDWKWSPEVFPFWWDDTWHQEIDLMINGMPSQKTRAVYEGARAATANGREFTFWLNVFIKLRKRRRVQALAIATKLGVEMTPRPDVEKWFEAYDQQMTAACPGFEERFGDTRDPPARYLAAKARAEQILLEIA